MLKPFRDNFAMADTDHDGALSPKEFQAASEYMQKSGRPAARAAKGKEAPGRRQVRPVG